MKISYNNYRFILNIKKKPIFIQRFLRYDLFVTDVTASVKVFTPMWLYILLFIPAHIATALMCMWDGGLKEFELAHRHIQTLHFYKGDAPYNRAKEIYEIH